MRSDERLKAAQTPHEVTAMDRLLPSHTFREPDSDSGYPMMGARWQWSTTAGVWTVLWKGAILGVPTWEVSGPGGGWTLVGAADNDGIPEKLPALLRVLGAIDGPGE